MAELASQVLYVFDWLILVYFLVLNSTYLVLLSLAAVELVGRMRREAFSGREELFANPLSPGVSILLPAFNEGEVIVDSATALLTQRYPHFELIVIDDGSTDDTFARLDAAFGLVRLPHVHTHVVPLGGEITAIYVARDATPLTVVRKRNAGRVADALNAGLSVAAMPLVCMIDADSLLEEDALLRITSPFVDDPRHVVAAGGTVRPVNGSVTYRGRVTQPRMPRSWIARIQAVEYLRAFLMARLGWARLRALPMISGAFGVFRRDLLIELGGMRIDAIGQDLELLLRVYRLIGARGRGERVAYIPDPTCWTQVPEVWGALARQRTRWSHGLAEALWLHRSALGNPRQGRIGMLLLPYMLLFELAGPVVEVVGIAAVIAGLALGVVDVPFAVLFLVVAVGYSLLISLASLALEEFSYFRYGRWRDLLVFACAALVEQVGFRQAHALWRLRGVGNAVRRRQMVWGENPRTAFGSGHGGSGTPGTAHGGSGERSGSGERGGPGAPGTRAAPGRDGADHLHGGGHLHRAEHLVAADSTSRRAWRDD